MVFTRKRVYAGKPRSFGFKKRRINKRKYGFRRRNNVTYGSSKGNAVSFGFRAKKLSRRRYQKKLWDDTLNETHYRTNYAVHQFVASTAAQGTASTITFRAIHNGNAFWTTAGGAIGPDNGVAVPIFRGDITVRGGVHGLSFFNSNSAMTLFVKAYLIKTTSDPDPAIVAATVPIGWDPTLIPDFKSRFGKIIFKKEFVLETLASETIERRIPIMKVDQGSWNTDLNGVFYWMVIVSDPLGALTGTLEMDEYVNMSFSGDATT